tara:strand:+ start:445 stop:621 length:177 start_codon:yes stop_codon:yes gene_type:complete
MFKFLLGVIVGTIWSVEITSFWESTGIGQEIQQQWIRYNLNKEGKESEIKTHQEKGDR